MKKLALVMVVMLAGCGLEINWEDFKFPTPTPTPTPTATPEPTPTATVEPSPFPTPSVSPVVCPEFKFNGSYYCQDNPGGLEFKEDVSEAQRLAANNGFVKNGIVLDEYGYTREVARILNVMGLCAVSGADYPGAPGDEVWVKWPDSNEFSAHWDLVRGGNNEALTHNASRCKPAHF